VSTHPALLAVVDWLCTAPVDRNPRLARGGRGVPGRIVRRSDCM
jgi:hypothetical protein